MAMLVAEWLLAALYLVALVRLRPRLRPNARVAFKVAIAAVVALIAVPLPVPDLARAATGIAIYVAMILGLRAIPKDVWRAFIELRRASPTMTR